MEKIYYSTTHLKPGNTMWEPISITELYNRIIQSEQKMTASEHRFWKMLKIDPEKWTLTPEGNDGGGFWVIGLLGKNCIWFNDVEKGFNVSGYDYPGEIKEYRNTSADLIVLIQSFLLELKS
jgi:hypothetical protein